MQIIGTIFIITTVVNTFAPIYAMQLLNLRLQLLLSLLKHKKKLRCRFENCGVVSTHCTVVFFSKKLHRGNRNCISVFCEAALQATGNSLAVLPQMAVFTTTPSIKTSWTFHSICIPVCSRVCGACCASPLQCWAYLRHGGTRRPSLDSAVAFNIGGWHALGVDPKMSNLF